MLNKDIDPTNLIFTIVRDAEPDDDGHSATYFQVNGYGVSLEIGYTDENNATYMINNFHQILQYFINRTNEESAAMEEFEAGVEDFLLEVLSQDLTEPEE